MGHSKNNLSGINRLAKYRVYGFTVLELMVVMTITAILVALAIPGFEDARRNNFLATSANEFSASLNRARAEAIKSRRNVRMCPTTDNSACSGTNWAGGWIMFVDSDGNGLPAATELIRIGAALDSRVALTSPTAFTQWVQFRPSGAVLGNGGIAGDFSLCSGDYHKYSRRVGITATGRVTAKKQPNLCVEES